MLTGKQKRYLRSLANQYKSIIQVGKGGTSCNMYETLSMALEANELCKVNVLKTCQEEVRQVAFDLASNTNSEIVQIIGKTIIFYRQSKEHIIELP